MKTGTVVAVLILVLAAAGIWLAAQYGQPATADGPQRATAKLPEGYLEASTSWFADKREHEQLEKQITAGETALAKLPQVRDLQAKRDLMNGLGLRLVNSMPCFYRWDDKVEAFKPIAPADEQRRQCANQRPPEASQSLVAPPPAPAVPPVKQ